MRWSCLVAALCTLLLACGGSDVHDKGPGAELAQGARPLRAASSEPPSAPGAAVTADVVTTRGELTVSFALPKLPSRAGLDPQLTLSHDGSAVDLGSGFGAGFSLGVPSIRASTEYGLTLPRNRAAPDPLGTPLTY